ncbi:MAG: fibrobacter succinogenes major paralogous domain-containing protein [Bacteroidales bacterium]|nr:fibrobacter succinogenes major paralogous domain-containing protein [Bacteroidales bacterium]
MKWIFTLITATVLTISTLAQSPEKMSYQAVIRNSNNQLVTNQAVGMQISIVQSTADGAVVYAETHNPTTNANGLLSIEIGTGTTSDDFTSINWANGPYFIKTETDPAGGTNYTITGTSQLLSVPYALYAKTADSISNIDQKVVMTSGDQVVAGNKTFTGAFHPYYIEVNSFGTGNRHAFIDFHGDDTYTDYSLRLARYNSGQSLLEHRGTNMMSIQTSDSADIRLATKGIQRMRIDANGNIIVNDLMRNYKTLRIYDQSNKTLFFRQDGDNSYISNKQNFLNSETPKNGWLFINGESGVSLRVGRNGVAGTEAMRVDTFTNIDMLNHQVINVKTPVNDQDAANKAYVDALEQIIYYVLEDPTNRGLVKDADGNTYKTIKIGTQVWMAENLKTTKDKNGAAIPEVADATAWKNLTTSGYCWYNNDETNKGTYGALYNWYTVNTGNLCPTGWHVPSDAEWTTLTNLVGNSGGKLKEAGYAHWISPNVGATNQTGFTALPGGYRYNGIFSNIGSYGRWWSNSLDATPNYALARHLIYDSNNVTQYSAPKITGFSVRCLKD